jgi:hypothetical protein
MWKECEETVRTLQRRDLPQDWSTSLLSAATVPSKQFTIAALESAWREKCAKDLASLERQLQEIVALVSLDPWSTVLIDTRLAPIIMSRFSHRSISTLKATLLQDRRPETFHQYGFTVMDYVSLGVYCSVVLAVFVLLVLHKWRKFERRDRKLIVHALLTIICVCVVVQIFAHTGFTASNAFIVKHGKISGLSSTKTANHRATYDGKKFACAIDMRAELFLDVAIGSKYARSTARLEYPFDLTFSCEYTADMSFASFAKHTPTDPAHVLETMAKEMTEGDFKHKDFVATIRDGGNPEMVGVAEDLLFAMQPRIESVFEDRITPLFVKCCRRMLGFASV